MSHEDDQEQTTSETPAWVPQSQPTAETPAGGANSPDDADSIEGGGEAPSDGSADAPATPPAPPVEPSSPTSPQPPQAPVAPANPADTDPAWLPPAAKTTEADVASSPDPVPGSPGPVPPPNAEPPIAQAPNAAPPAAQPPSGPPAGAQPPAAQPPAAQPPGAPVPGPRPQGPIGPPPAPVGPPPAPLGQLPPPGPAQTGPTSYPAPNVPLASAAAHGTIPTADESGGKRSKWGLVLGVAVIAALVGAVISFVATRDSDDDVVATNPTSLPTTTALVEPDPTTTEAAPLGAEQLSRSVVQIQLLLDGSPVCTGSGTIVDTAGTVVTNFHVVEQSPLCPHDRIGVAVADSSQAIPALTYEADLLAFDSDLDLAVIRIARDLDGLAVEADFQPIELGDSDAVELGDQIRVIGYPGIGGETVTFTTGSVSGFAETPEGGERSWLKTDATIAGGNSGGLAADADGRFVGIPTRAGTGNGQIVDCRVIADSNGDGRLDDADSCVPIGGFINGIRPVALALPLIEEARSAVPIDQGPPEREEPMSPDLPAASNPIWTSALTDEGRATDDLIAVGSGIPELCLTWDYDNVPSGSTSDAIWLIDGETIPEASILDGRNEGDSSGSFFACINRGDGLLPGIYELVWLVEDELVFAEGIIVDEGAVAVIEVFNDTEVPLCVVQFNPTGTRTYGLNDLAESIEPGQSVIVEVARGPIDARIIDCDGDIRIEDSTGFLVEEDLLVTVD